MTQWISEIPFYLFIVAMFAIYFSAISYRYRRTEGRRYFWFLGLMVAFDLVTTSFELMTTSHAGKLVWRNIEQIPLFLTSLAIYGVCADYVGKSLYSVRKQLLLLLLPMIVYFALIFTDGRSHLLRASVSIQHWHGLSAIDVHPTALDTLFVAYTQVLCLIAIFFLARHLGHSKRHLYPQHVLLLVGFSITVALNVIEPVVPFHIVGYTAMSAAPGMAVVFYALFRYELLSNWPIAKDRVFEVLREGIILTDHRGIIVDINPAGERMLLGIAKSESRLSLLGHPLDGSLHATPALREAYAARRQTIIDYHTSDDYFFSISLVPIGASMLLVISDVTDKKRHERHLMAQATVDDLTGLANRRHFLSIVRNRLENVDTVGALFLIDIDNFKQINDSHGHMVGDEVLTKFGALLRETLPEALVGRMGGEEFAVFVESKTGQSIATIAEQLRSAVEGSQLVEVNGLPLSVTTSIGVALTNHGHRKFEELYHQADRGLYLAKESGKNQVKLV